MYVNIARHAVFEDRGAVGLHTGCRVSFFTDAADAIAARLLARVCGLQTRTDVAKWT